MEKPIDLLGHSYSHLVNSKAFSPFNPSAPERIGEESYVEIFEVGVSLVLPDGVIVETVHLHSQGHEGYIQFGGELPDGLSFDMDRQHVRSLLGEPYAYSDGVEVIILGKKPAWDAYKRNGYHLHVEYSDDRSSIRLITLNLI
ncbi:hypothetical protein [Chromobacterium vaccinii]|uniref:hypothetical protein n=1 Tax=Chromobacterium vaccinii TaxID=1108595 RepID=UPI0031D28C2A